MNRTQWLNHLRQVDRERDEKKKLEMVDKLIDEELEENERVVMERAGVRLDYDGDGLDDDLDAEDVLAAVTQRNRENAIRRLRKEYYAVSDGLFGLSEISATLYEDETLRRDIYMLMQKLDDVEKHLTETYKWD
jgi:hypothetical protein